MDYRNGIHRKGAKDAKKMNKNNTIPLRSLRLRGEVLL
jgi:hypothetical protein